MRNEKGAKAPTEENMKGKIMDGIGYTALLMITACLYVGCFGVPV